MRALPWRAILCDSSSWRLLSNGCGDRRPTMDGERSRRSFFSPSVQQAPGHPLSVVAMKYGRLTRGCSGLEFPGKVDTEIRAMRGSDEVVHGQANDTGPADLHAAVQEGRRPARG